jgi:hypothetical protein
VSAKQDNLQAWEAEIAQILHQVAYAREVLASGGVPEPPQWVEYRLGRIPASLREQAREAATQLEAVQREIKAAMERNRAERDRLCKMPKQKSETMPLYLDVEG